VRCLAKEAPGFGTSIYSNVGNQNRAYCDRYGVHCASKWHLAATWCHSAGLSRGLEDSKPRMWHEVAAQCHLTEFHGSPREGQAPEVAPEATLCH